LQIHNRGHYLSCKFTHLFWLLSRPLFTLSLSLYSLRLARLPASKAVLTEVLRTRDRRGPEGGKEEREIGTNPEGWWQLWCLQRSNPLGPGGAGKVQLNRQSSQLPNNVPCTDPVSQAIALTRGGWVGNKNSLLPERLLTGD
jgi:hypothetical protein